MHLMVLFGPAGAGGAHCGGEMRSFVGRCQIAIFSSQRMKSLLQQRMPWEALKPRAMSVGQSGNDEVRRQRARPFEVENAPSPYDARFSKKGSCLIQAFQQTRTLMPYTLSKSFSDVKYIGAKLSHTCSAEP